MYHYYDLLFKEIFGTQKNIIYLDLQVRQYLPQMHKVVGNQI